MRTTLDIDGDLLAAAQSQFAPGTPKTVIIEEALRSLLERPRRKDGGSKQRFRDPRLERLAVEGRLVTATAEGPPPRQTTTKIRLKKLLQDLARDREDR